MSSTKHTIIASKATASERRKELIEQLNHHVEDNGNTNVLMVHAIAQHVGLSATEFECCSLIQDYGPFTAGELARRCHITTGGMTGVIDRLARRGFVKREADPNDRRRVMVYALPNDEARKKVSALYEPLRVAFNELIDTYNDDELAFIVAFMTRVNKMFHDTVDSLPQK